MNFLMNLRSVFELCGRMNESMSSRSLPARNASSCAGVSFFLTGTVFSSAGVVVAVVVTAALVSTTMVSDAVVVSP
jgi:hypothetical protein